MVSPTWRSLRFIEELQGMHGPRRREAELCQKGIIQSS